MSEYGILKWSLVVAALLAIFTKAPRVMEGDGRPSLLEQRDPYGYGGRFAGQPVDVWLTIEATNRKTGEAISHVDSIRVSRGGKANEGKEVRSSRDVAVFISDSAYLPIDSGRLRTFFIPAAKIGYPLWVNAYSNGYHMSEHWLTPTMHESEREENGNSLFVKAKMKFGPVDTKWLVMPIDRLTGEDLTKSVAFQLFDEDENEVNDVAMKLTELGMECLLPPSFQGLLRVQLEGYYTHEVEIDNDMKGVFRDRTIVLEMMMERLE